MRTPAERERLDRKFRRISKFGKFVKNHISKTIGTAIVEWNYDRWGDSY